jgi:hypothetical protein
MSVYRTLATVALAASAVVLGRISARAGDGGTAGSSHNCAKASEAVVGANPFSSVGSTADLVLNDSPCGGHTIFRATYFRFTAAVSGLYTFDTCGAESWDTRIAIMNACDPAAGVIGCNDDACAYRSQAGAALVANQTYIIAIGAYYGGETGVGTLNITEPAGGGGSGSPDVIVGALPDYAKYGSAVVNGQTIMAYAFGTTSCNIGTGQLSWYGAPDNRHPFIPTNMYRFKSGRLEQIGMSWGKHGFCALQGTLCGACIPAGSGCPPILGIGCSDPYSAGLNGDQGGLGTRKEVNAATGVFPGSYNAGMPAAAPTIGRRLQVNATDLNPALNSGALYLIEGQYIHPEDAAAGNDDNNASWRQFTVGSLTSGAYNLALTGATRQQEAAIEAWGQFVGGVEYADIAVPGDGLFIAANRVTDNGNGTWRYEYAIQNLNSDRAARALSIPLPAGAVVTNAGFRDVNYHSGDPYDATDWSISTTGGAITWSGGVFATNPNGNALRFATMYNFWFDANRPPIAASATLGLFKPGSPGDPAAMAVTLRGPAAGPPGDFNGDNKVNAADLTILLGNWGGSGVGDINGDGSVGAQDLAALLSAWT